jgi:TrmH family RNA methyltransferase
MALDTLVERYRLARRNPELAVIEGFHAFKHALRFGADIVEAAAAGSTDLEMLAARLAPDVGGAMGAIVQRVPDGIFAVLSPGHVPTGVIAIAHRPSIAIDETFAGAGATPIVLLENARSPFNVGAAVRVAAAASAAGVFVTGNIDPWSPAALRASAGLAFALPVAHINDLPDSDRPIIAIDPVGEDLPSGMLPARAVLAFGGERAGLSDGLREAASRRVRIPMREGVSSLNLATAVAVVLYTMAP